MLRIMGDRSADNDRRDDMAKAAAPYVHAKLSAVDHSGTIDLSLADKLGRAIARSSDDAASRE